jgi:hypothetical protein
MTHRSTSAAGSPCDGRAGRATTASISSKTLWTGWLRTQVYGRIGSRLGRARSFEQPSIEEALFTLATIAKRRRQRGYRFDA